MGEEYDSLEALSTRVAQWNESVGRRTLIFNKMSGKGLKNTVVLHCPCTHNGIRVDYQDITATPNVRLCTKLMVTSEGRVTLSVRPETSTTNLRQDRTGMGCTRELEPHFTVALASQHIHEQAS